MIEGIQEFGYGLLKGVIDPPYIRSLADRMLSDVPRIMSRPEVPTQFVQGHIQHDPPVDAALLFADVLCNIEVVAVTSGVLGEGVRNVAYTGNTNLPGSLAQPIHHDGPSLWPNVVHPATTLVVNVAVVDIDENNGAIELWPGTHLDAEPTPDGSLRIPTDRVEKRRAEREPIRVRMRAGDVLVRDGRLWHRGMPNLSDAPRPMIAMIHMAGWLSPSLPPIEFPKGTEHVFGNSRLRQHATFVDGPIDHLGRHEPHDVR